MERKGPEAEQEGRDDGSWEDEAVGNYWGRPARPRARRALHFFGQQVASRGRRPAGARGRLGTPRERLRALARALGRLGSLGGAS